MFLSLSENDMKISFFNELYIKCCNTKLPKYRPQTKLYLIADFVVR